jgi:2'-5' RNA ligase
VGVFVFLRPDPAAAAEIARFGDVPAADVHLTLRFLGSRSDLPPGAADRLRRELGALAARRRAFLALVARQGMFMGDREDAVYATADSPELAPLRADVVRAADAAGVRGDDSHAFVPHLTLGRVPHGSSWDRPPPFLRVRFDAVWISWSKGETEAFRFAGDR